MKIGGAALNQTPIAWDNNFENIVNAISEAEWEGVELLCLPEMAICGYGCEDLFYAPWFLNRCLSQLKALLPYTTQMAVNFGIPLLIDDKLYNCMAMVKRGELLGFTAKQNLANDGVHYEHRWFSPWPAFKQTSIEIDGRTYPVGDLTYDINGYCLAFEICEDAWLGKKRTLQVHLQKERKPDIVFNPNASHFAFGKHLHRKSQLVLEGSRIINGVFVLTNLLGNEGGKMIYDGDVYIAQQGHLVANNRRLSFRDFVLTTAEIDFGQAENSKGERAIDLISKEQNMTQCLALGLFDYLRKSKSKGFVLSLSGGADSASCAILVAEMVKRAITELGNQKFLEKINREDLIPQLVGEQDPDQQLIVSNILTCAYQATENSSADTFHSAEALARQIGATFYHWSIDEQVASYKKIIEQQLQRTLSWEQDDIALQNIQARARSPIIWMLANINQALLLTTSNRSEANVGYTTMDGDSSGSIAPIGGVDKHYVRQWLIWAEKDLGYDSLHHVNNLQPSAELRPRNNAQTDEDDLMPYSIMLRIEQLAFVQRLSPWQIFEVMQKEESVLAVQLKLYISRFFRMWSRNQWKRERTAPAFHVDVMSVDPRSWLRFPILSGGFDKELEELEKYNQS